MSWFDDVLKGLKSGANPPGINPAIGVNNNPAIGVVQSVTTVHTGRGSVGNAVNKHWGNLWNSIDHKHQLYPLLNDPIFRTIGMLSAQPGFQWMHDSLVPDVYVRFDLLGDNWQTFVQDINHHGARFTYEIREDLKTQTHQVWLHVFGVNPELKNYLQLVYNDHIRIVHS